MQKNNKGITTCECKEGYKCVYNPKNETFRCYGKDMKFVRSHIGNVLPKEGFEDDCLIAHGLNKLLSNKK